MPARAPSHSFAAAGETRARRAEGHLEQTSQAVERVARQAANRHLHPGPGRCPALDSCAHAAGNWRYFPVSTSRAWREHLLSLASSELRPAHLSILRKMASLCMLAGRRQGPPLGCQTTSASGCRTVSSARSAPSWPPRRRRTRSHQTRGGLALRRARLCLRLRRRLRLRPPAGHCRQAMPLLPVRPRREK